MKYMKFRYLSFHLSYKVVNTRTRRRIEVAVIATSVEHSLEAVTPSSSFLKEKLKQGYSFKKTRTQAGYNTGELPSVSHQSHRFFLADSISSM